MRCRAGIIFALVLAALGCARAACAVTYVVTHLQGTAVVGDRALAINDYGQVVGTAGTRGFLWSPSTPNATTGFAVDIGALGGRSALAGAINNLGQVGGWATNSTEAPRWFLWQPLAENTSSGQKFDLRLPALASEARFDMNDFGQIAGTRSVSGLPRAIVWTPSNPNQASGLAVSLGTFGGSSSWVNGLNAMGQAAGAATYSDGRLRAFLWMPASPNGTSGRKVDIGTLDGDATVATDIADDGRIAGWSLLAGERRAFLWTPEQPNGSRGAMIPLGTLGGISEAWGVNERGQVVGWSALPGGAARAFLWQADTGMVDLNRQIGASSGWVLERALGINESGQIVGAGRLNGIPAAFLLTAGLLPPEQARWLEGPSVSGPTLTATWQPPLDAGPGVSHYRVRVKANSRDFLTGPFVAEVVVSADQTSRVFTEADGLRAGRWYAFEVTAIDVTGVGSNGAVSPLAAVGMGSITGVLTRPDGAPLSGAGVSVRVHGTQSEVRAARTDTRGRFIAPAIPAGTYDLRVSHRDMLGTTFNGGGTGYEVTADRNTDIALVAPINNASVWGVVRDPSGRGVPEAIVTVFRDRHFATTVRTALNGIYVVPSIRMVPEARIQASAAGYQAFTDPAPLVPLAGTSLRRDVTLQPDGTLIPEPQGGSYSGVVLDGVTGQPVPHAHVYLTPEGGGQPTSSFSAWDGRFVLAPVPVGNYTFSARAAGYLNHASTFLTVGPGGSFVRTVRLFPLPAVEGVVTVDGQPANAVPVARVGGPETWTTAEGWYRIVLPGTRNTITTTYDRTISHLVNNPAPGSVTTIDFAF